MTLVISFIFVFIVCALMFRFLPSARFWECRGCTGWIAKDVRDREEERQKAAAETSDKKREQ